MKMLQFCVGTLLCSLVLITNAAVVLTVPRDKTLSAVLNADGVDGALKQNIIARLFLADPSLKTTLSGKNAIRKLFGNDESKIPSAEDLEGAPSANLPKEVTAKIDAVKTAANKKDATKAALTEIGQQIGKGIVTASKLTPDEVGTALLAGMKK